ncbi:MAG: TonB-dependent receptor, partial [Bacteroidota bacterium]
RFLDWQSYFVYRPDSDTEISLLTSIASNRYQVVPQSRTTTFGTFNQQLRFLVNYEGEEQMNYDTYQTGLQVKRRLAPRWETRLLISAMQTYEREYINLLGAYRLCDVDTDVSSSTFNQCAVTRGSAAVFDYGRNLLEATITSASWRNEYIVGDQSFLEFGARFQHETINDRLYEYNYLDSADFVEVENFIESQTELSSDRFMAYAQMTHYLDGKKGNSFLNYGMRVNYWSLNGQWLFSPRLKYAFTPDWEKDISFNFALGVYQQPPFYRELRDFEGNINRDLKAQSSFHAIAGLDWDFKMWDRPFKFISEAYYKRLWNVIPYDIDNVRLRYYANNDAEAFIGGVDFRLSGEFIKGTESWLSLSTLLAREDVGFDEQGFIRRPTDQRVTVAVFFQDHIPNDPTLRMYLRLQYGTGLPFGVPNRPNTRAQLSGEQYRRVDIGISKSLIFEQNKGIKSLWLGVEILNVLGVENVISYNFIRDFLNDRQYAIPNSLSQRFFNLKVIGKF